VGRKIRHWHLRHLTFTGRWLTVFADFQGIKISGRQFVKEVGMGNPAEGKRSITRIESILRQALKICQQQKMDFSKKIYT
jgi:hypothetical protein